MRFLALTEVAWRSSFQQVDIHRDFWRAGLRFLINVFSGGSVRAS
jgi:hypothetical protein